MLRRSRALAPAGRLAGQVEPSVSTGRATRAGSPAAALSLPSRILATAALFQTKREARPHRPALTVARDRRGSSGTTSAPVASTARSSTPCCAPPASGCSVVRPARPASPPGDRGPAVPGPRPVQPRDREDAGDQPEDRRQPRRARLRQDRRRATGRRPASSRCATGWSRRASALAEGPDQQLARDAGGQLVARARR